MSPRTRLLLLGGAVVAPAVAASCARQSAPPGGPPDNRPPVVVAITPDTFASVEAGRGRIQIVFDERISERPASGQLDDVVSISPRTGNLRVGHNRSGLEAELDGGFRPGLVYRVRVEPLVTDMFGNSMRAPFEWVFSTGGAFENNVVGGFVWDRFTGEPIENAQVVLRAAEPDAPGFDTLPEHVALTDSGGIFALRYVPAGRYTMTVFEDQNRNDAPNDFERQGRRLGVEVASGDTVVATQSVMVPDTTPPRVARLELVDSVTIRVHTDDPIDPSASLAGVVPGIFRQDEEGDAPSVTAILHEREWGRVRDSIRAERATAAADSAAAAAADSVGVDPAVPPRELDPGQPEAPTPGVEAALLPDGTPIPEPSFVVRLAGPLEPGVAYVVRIQDVPNILGLTSAQEETTITREPPVEPPPGAPPDSAALAPPDTGRVVRR